MIRFVALSAILAVLVLNSFGYAQNADYFTASQNPDLKHYLFIVENNHLLGCSHNGDPIITSENQKPRIDNRGGTVADMKNGRFDYAKYDLNYVLERFVNHPKALMILGVFAKLTKAPLFPIPYYEKALMLYPQYALTHAQYGAYLVDIGRTDAGIAKLKKAIGMDPNLAFGHQMLVKAYLKIGNKDLARQAAERAKEISQKGREQKQDTAEQADSGELQQQ
jgi:tetratricopeptide (TPR) repeat protein